MNKPFFSIITCTYNSAKYLEQNLSSVRSQSFTDYEHIFVDGFSKDDTIEQIKKYNHGVLFQAPAKGIANAMNLGIKQASGEYLLFLNSDDYFFNDQVLELAAKQIKQGNYTWYYGITNMVSASGKILASHPVKKWQQHFWYWVVSLTFYMQHQSVFYAKSLFNKYGLYDEAYNAMDFEHALRISKNERAGFLKFTISNFRLGGFSSQNKKVMDDDTLRAFKKYLPLGAVYFYLSKIYQFLFVKNIQKNLD